VRGWFREQTLTERGFDYRAPRSAIYGKLLEVGALERVREAYRAARASLS